jgi:hypothetical protein
MGQVIGSKLFVAHGKQQHLNVKVTGRRNQS